MKDPQIDPERLASLLDGRLDASERAALLEQLADSDELLAVYADAAAVAREMEEAGAGEAAPAAAEPRGAGDVPGITPIRSTRRALPGARVLGLAAMIAMVALAPWLWMRSRAAVWVEPGRGIAHLQSADLPAGWEARPWSTSRGADDPLPPLVRAARAGALMVDLELATRADDPALPALATELALLLEGVPGAAPAAARYRQAARLAPASPSAVEPLLEGGWADAARFLDEDRMRLSALAELSRIAAAQRDAAFFRAPPVEAAWDRAADLRPLSPGALAAIREVRDTASGAEPDWAAVGSALDSLLRILGS